jgi:hypothetical protein
LGNTVCCLLAAACWPLGSGVSRFRGSGDRCPLSVLRMGSGARVPGLTVEGVEG